MDNFFGPYKIECHCGNCWICNPAQVYTGWPPYAPFYSKPCEHCWCRKVTVTHLNDHVACCNCGMKILDIQAKPHGTIGG